jgi:alanyl-tRNA synthetase
MKFGRQLGKTEPFLHELVPLVVRVMGDAYPELVREEPQVTTLIRVEEQSFDQTLNRSLPLFMRYLEQLKVKGETTLPGQIVFFLYATHGFPLDLMKDIARDEGMTLDEAGFQQCLQEDARQSAAHADFKAASIPETLQELAKTLTIHHDPYGPLTQSGTILALVQKESLVEALRAGETGQIVLDCTPFYAESGGQIGDLGIIQTPNGCFEVSHTEKVLDRLILHHGTVISGCVTLKDLATAKVDQPNRQAIRKNHTATHLLHQALKEVLGWHVKQAGSLVDAEKLRFDFNHFAPMSSEEWRLVEEKVNREILANTHLDTSICDLEEAKASGAMALFGEKYQSRVRVVTIGSYSKELCGGTHVQATGEIGPFVIASEKGLASGVRRIVAHTGAAALSWFQRQRGILSALQDQLKTSEDLLITSLIKLQEEKKSLQTQLEQAKLALAKGGQLLEHSATIGPWTILVKEVSGVEAGSLRQLADELLSRIKKGAVLIASDLGDKVQLVAKSNAISVGLNAGDWVKLTAPFVDGSGGGRPEMAMAGGKNAKGIPQALEQAHRWAQDRLSETSS